MSFLHLSSAIASEMTGSHKHRYQCSGPTLASTTVQHCIHHCIIVLLIQPVNFLYFLLGRPTLVGKALSFTHELSFIFFIFFINPRSTALITRALDGHEMYSGGSVVGKASTIHHHHLFRPAVQNSSYKNQLTASRTVRLSSSANNCL